MPGKKKLPSKKTRKTKSSPGLDFNHAMVYSKDVAASLQFYRDSLGFKLVEQMEHHNSIVYVRLRAPQGTGTLALHMIEPGKTIAAGGGVRLYFEIKDLDNFCTRLQDSGVMFSKLPQLMPWGWKHAYLDDPDGNEISLYWAGAKRFRTSKMPR